MTVEELANELYVLLSDLCFGGLKNAQPALLKRLDVLRKWLDELGMAEGAAQVDAFMETMRARHAGEGDTRQAADQLCALAFYCTILLENCRSKETKSIS